MGGSGLHRQEVLPVFLCPPGTWPMARMSFIWRAMGTAAPMIFSHASAETLSFPKWFSTMAVGAFPLRNPGISACPRPIASDVRV